MANRILARVMEFFTAGSTIADAQSGQMPIKYKDMGDGTYAEVVAVGDIVVQADTINMDTADLETAIAGTNSRIGANNDAAANADTGNFSINALFKRLLQKWTTGLAIFGANGSSAASTSNPVPISAAERVFAVDGATLIRPANTTAYSAGDSISNNATAGSVTALSVTVADINDAPVTITEIELDTTDTGLAAGVQVDVFVFNSDPTADSGVVAGDNAAFSQKRAGFRGTFTAFQDGGKATCRPVDGDNEKMAAVVMTPESGGRRLWYVMRAVTGFAPSANLTTIVPRFKGFQGRA